MRGYYRTAWQGRWAEYGDDLRQLCATADDVLESLEAKLVWHGELATELQAVAALLLESGDWAAYVRVREVAKQLAVEAGADSTSDTDCTNAAFLAGRLELLANQADRYGEGLDHF